MIRAAGLVAWCDRWLNNGANLITLSRLPMIPFILATILPHKEHIADWYPWLLGTTTLGIFWQGGIAQTVGMIADGLDGWFARSRWSKRGPTPEGQFLDQFFDKIFIWIPWLAFLFWFFCSDWWHLAIWIPSLYLFFLDCRSCLKHWRNYLRDRGKPVDRSHGAVWQGKAKFVFENVFVCVNLGALCPLPTADTYLWYHWISWFLHTVGIWLQPYSFVFILIAIALARGSLTSRGVIKSKKRKPKLFARSSHRRSQPRRETLLRVLGAPCFNKVFHL